MPRRTAETAFLESVGEDEGMFPPMRHATLALLFTSLFRKGGRHTRTRRTLASRKVF